MTGEQYVRANKRNTQYTALPVPSRISPPFFEFQNFFACVLYLDEKFVYYGIGVTAVGNIIHIIVQVITKRADGIELFFSIIILATVVYAVYEASILLTKFSEENLEMQAAASEKMLATAENLVKHFDSAKEK